MRWEWDGRAFSDCLVFRRVNEEADCQGHRLLIGALSNMSSRFPLRVNGARTGSSEALYQACRFPDQPEWQREIFAAPNGMIAKMMARKGGRRRFHSRSDWDEIRVKVMRWCLRVKLALNYQDFFVRLLRWTDPLPIVERSKKDRFWSAVEEEDGVLRGANHLGRLLMELRDQAIALRAAGRESELLRVDPPPIENFRLLGREIGVVNAAGLAVGSL